MSATKRVNTMHPAEAAFWLFAAIGLPASLIWTFQSALRYVAELIPGPSHLTCRDYSDTVTDPTMQIVRLCYFNVPEAVASFAAIIAVLSATAAVGCLLLWAFVEHHDDGWLWYRGLNLNINFLTFAMIGFTLSLAMLSVVSFTAQLMQDNILP